MFGFYGVLTPGIGIIGPPEVRICREHVRRYARERRRWIRGW
jgi:hypothetical protein